jgi:hypothetical protein
MRALLPCLLGPANLNTVGTQQLVQVPVVGTVEILQPVSRRIAHISLREIVVYV